MLLFGKKREDDFIAGMDTDAKWRARMGDTTEIHDVEREKKRVTERAQQAEETGRLEPKAIPSKRVSTMDDINRVNEATMQQRQRQINGRPQEAADRKALFAFLMSIMAFVTCNIFFGISAIILSRIGKFLVKRAEPGPLTTIAKLTCAASFFFGLVTFVFSIGLLALALVTGIIS